MSMIEKLDVFFNSPIFSNFVLPIISTFIVIFVKMSTKNDIYKSARKEDFALGIDISVVALMIFMTDITKNINNYSSERKTTVVWVTLIYLFLIWALSTLMRKFGWKSEDELKWMWGIIVPNIVGLCLFMFSIFWTGVVI